MDDKQKLRKTAGELRDQLAHVYGYGAAAKAAEHGLTYLSVLPKDRVIALYSAMNSELDPCFLANDLIRKGYTLALPVVGNKDTPLTFRRWAPGDPMEKGVYGTVHPSAEAPEVTPDVIITPLLAFTQTGYRMGYGGGFYDRTLVGLPTTKSIGFAFMGQMVDAMPIEPHDMSVEAVITENGIVLCGDK